MTNHTVNETINSTGFLIQEYTINSGYDLLAFILIGMVFPILAYLSSDENLHLFGFFLALIGGVVVLISQFHPLFFLAQLIIIILLLIKVVDSK